MVLKVFTTLHIWTITSGLNALTCHAVVNEKMTIEESEILLRKVEHELEHIMNSSRYHPVGNTMIATR
jgi:Co/Zn/Cd efflux system component